MTEKKIAQRKKRPLADRFWEKVYITEPRLCWEWTGALAGRGYGVIVGPPRRSRRNGKMEYAHRVSYEIARGPIPAGLWVLHRCDNPPCCNPAHLFLGTHADNMTDMKTKGRQTSGERNGQARLIESDVREIRKVYAKGDCSQQTLAQIFGVSRFMIGLIVRRERWKHVKSEESTT